MQIRYFLFCLLAMIFSVDISVAQASFENVATGRPVAADSEEEPARAAVDGLASSYWQSGAAFGEHWLEIDLEDDYKLDHITIPRFSGFDSLVVEAWIGQKWVFLHGSAPDFSPGNSPDNPVFAFEPVTTRKIRIRSAAGGQVRIYEVEIYPYDPQPILINQSGFDTEGIKRFTAPDAEDGTTFFVYRMEDNTQVYQATILNKKGDFSAFQPKQAGLFYIKTGGDPEGTSVPFGIGPNWIERSSYQQAINFMIDARCWFGDSRKFEPTDDSPGCPDKGVAWRDSHQMSFEIQSLLNLYFANPSAFTVDRMPVQGRYLGLREQLAEDTPEIIRLIYWAVDIYLRGEVNHTLLKEQLAYFVYSWPYLSEYIPLEVYEEARDYVFAVWTDERIDRWQWHDIKHTGDLLQTYTQIGTGKGQFPPGHSIVPNLMMYEVARRENRGDAEMYFKAAFDQTQWLIDSLDWKDPRTTKGQRQGEQVTLTAFSYFLEQYPERAPRGLLEKIEEWTEVMITRSDNLWDFRRYSDERWIIPTIRGKFDPRHDSGTGFNEVGNVAGFPAPLLAAKRVLSQAGVRKKLDMLAASHIDHVFGRNPAGRHFGFDAALDFEGVERGWFQEYQGGAGKLQYARGVLDGSPKETLYPYNPLAGDPGHTEGWVTFNSPWNSTLGYLAADKTSIRLFDADFKRIVQETSAGKQIGIELVAPLNFDYAVREKAKVLIYLGEDQYEVEVMEENRSSNRFLGIFTIPQGSAANKMKVGYGYGWQEKSALLLIN